MTAGDLGNGPIKMVVADDSATMRQILQMTFAGENIDLIAVATGEAALNVARDAHPDVVIADVSMPGATGYDIAKAIKGDPSLSTTGVIVLASEHHPYDEARGSAAGVDAHVLKPFDTQALIDTVGQVLRTPRARTAGMHPSGTVRAASVPPPSVASAGAPRQVPMPSRASSTVSFGTEPPPAPPSRRPSDPVLEIVEDVDIEETTFESSPVIAGAVAHAGNGLEARLQGLGLSAEQVQAVLALSREVIEQVVWEVVPDLAETIIREEIRRLTAE